MLWRRDGTASCECIVTWVPLKSKDALRRRNVDGTFLGARSVSPLQVYYICVGTLACVCVGLCVRAPLEQTMLQNSNISTSSGTTGSVSMVAYEKLSKQHFVALQALENVAWENERLREQLVAFTSSKLHSSSEYQTQIAELQLAVQQAQQQVTQAGKASELALKQAQIKHSVALADQKEEMQLLIKTEVDKAKDAEQAIRSKVSDSFHDISFRQIV